LNVDARIQQSVLSNLSSRPAPIESGPFVIGFDPGTPNPGINYATPRPDAEISAADVTALVAAFETANRQPRLEYVTTSAPGLEELLVAAGFTVEARHEYLICVPGTLAVPATPAGFVLRDPADDADRLAMVTAQREAFGGPAAGDADVERMSRLQSLGGVSVMAVAGDGTCAGGGQAVPPQHRVSEVAGIAIRPEYRRRGLASAVTAAVTGRLFAAGTEIAWLEASGADSRRVYERIGYRATGNRLYISRA
jgi:predicted GNAT family acetyltransferase